MNENRKVCVITGSRAEYGLLSPLIDLISESDQLLLQLVVTGTHLSKKHGATYNEIEDDGFLNYAKVDISLSSDSEQGIAQSMSFGMVGFADTFSNLQPDLVVVLGDRFEIFVAVTVATIMRLPVAHIHGGETTLGSYDEAFRHSITKMSHLHFTATDEYYRRVIQLGESPKRVFNVGAIGIDNINNLNLLSRKSFEDTVGFKLGKRNLLITFHPVTLDTISEDEQFSNLLCVLDSLDNTHFIFTKANSDTGGLVINNMIDEFVEDHSDTAISFISMGKLKYLSAMQFIDGVIGNSSSGLIEAPSFNIGTINIGSRQTGRIKADSVIDCSPYDKDILDAITELYSDDFQSKLLTVNNPYASSGSSAKNIMSIIHGYPLDGILQKKFHDIKSAL